MYGTSQRLRLPRRAVRGRVDDLAKRRLPLEDFRHGTRVDDTSFGHDDDAVEIDERAQAMDRCDKADVGQAFAQPLEHSRLGRLVEGTRRLVEQQQRAVLAGE